jgi:Na+/H+ antiporter NhaC
VAGAGALLPALVVLLLAWTLGTMFEALGAAKLIAGALAAGATVYWLPCAVFALGCGMAFCTGTSWGTMALLMPLSLPTALALGHNAGMDPVTLQTLCVAVIGAVFGGATFGDHCSPFSDTTIVAALSSGCSTMDHVITQLPFALLVAVSAEVSYVGIALGLPAWEATLVAAAFMLLVLALLSSWRAPRPPIAKEPLLHTPT